MLPSPRQRREPRRAAGSAAPSLATLRYDTPGADGRHLPLAAPPLCTAPLLPWRSGAVWRVVAVAGTPAAQAVGECRWCFSAADAALEGELIEPCACSGSQRFVHTRCLRAWQLLCLNNGEPEKASHCAVCRGKFSLSAPRLSFRQRAFVFVRNAALHAVEAWVLGTGAACAAGTAGGALASLELLSRCALRALQWLDSYATVSSRCWVAAFCVCALPSAAFAAVLVTAFHVTFGAVFGFILGLAGGPVLLVHALLTLCRAVGRAVVGPATSLAFGAAVPAQ